MGLLTGYIMEFVWLEDFAALVHHGNFSRAASARGVTQPAFSRRIRALEEWASVELVDRSTHRISVTPAGERLAVIAETILRQIEHGRREVQEIADTSAATVNILVTHALAQSFFPRWLAALQSKTETSLIVRMTAENLNSSERMMLDGHGHFCLCFHHPSAPSKLDSSGFQHLFLGKDILVAVSAPDDRGQAPLHGLKEGMRSPVKLLAYGAGSGMGRIVTAVIRQNAMPVVFNEVFSSHTLVLTGMAKDGMGLAWLPLSIVADELERGTLVRAGDSRWDIAVHVRLYRPRARQSGSAEAFWKYAAS